MLEGMLLRDFQTHKNLSIDFDPLTTFLCGPSDLGKSSILRALWWLCANEPSGDKFIRHGTREASVTLRVDGHVIERVRGRTTNLYRLDGQEFANPSRDGIPTPIAKILNVGELNYQSQHSVPFWFFDSPGQVSRQLNGIINLGSIDNTLNNAASAVRLARAERDSCQQRLNEARDKRESLLYVADMDAELKIVEAVWNELSVIEQKAAELASVVASLAEHREAVQDAANALLDGLACVSAMEAMFVEEKRLKALQSLVAEIEASEEFCKDINKQIAEKETELASAMDGQCPLCQQAIS